MFKETNKQPSKVEVKKPKLVEVLADEIYSSIVEIGKQEGLTLKDSKFVNKVFWALIKVRLRLFDETNEAEREN
jgi:hypothetical protein